jgi:phospholipid/cholesterol/gamma-HCH transport system permease protein
MFLLDAVALTGQGARQITRSTALLTRFAGAVTRSTISYPTTAYRLWWRAVTNQVRFTAADALPFVGTIAAAIGAIVIVEASGQAVRFGLGDTLGRILASIVVRELGPLLTAILVIGRSGTAIAAELAACRVYGEIDALEAMGVNPLHYFVLPRIVGVAVSVAALTLVFDAITLSFGLLAARAVQQISLHDYVASLQNAMRPWDIVEVTLKGTISGAGIAALCCFEGLRAGRAPTEIPRAVTRAVVDSLLFVVGLAAVFAVLRFL